MAEKVGYMTCIVGIETKDGVIMGGDSGSSNGYDYTATRLKKVFRRGLFLIGYTSSFRMGQILQYRLEVKKKPKDQDDLEYLATIFIDAVRKCLKDGGYKKTENEVEEGGTFLVGYNGKLYYVGSDFQVNSTRNGFDSVGCGKDFAKGALFASVGLPPKKRVKQALKAAGHFSTGVCGPYHIIEMK